MSGRRESPMSTGTANNTWLPLPGSQREGCLSRRGRSSALLILPPAVQFIIELNSMAVWLRSSSVLLMTSPSLLGQEALPWVGYLWKYWGPSFHHPRSWHRERPKRPGNLQERNRGEWHLGGAFLRSKQISNADFSTIHWKEPKFDYISLWNNWCSRYCCKRISWQSVEFNSCDLGEVSQREPCQNQSPQSNCQRSWGSAPRGARSQASRCREGRENILH